MTVALAAARSGAPGAPAARWWTTRLRSALARVAGKLVLTVVPVFLASTFLTFLLGALSSADPAAIVLGEAADAQSLATYRHEFRLDRNIAYQYWHWLSHALRGDLGRSYFTGRPVTTIIAERLPVDLSVALAGLVLAAVLGMAAGLAAGSRPGSWVDRAVTSVTSVMTAVPEFIVGVLLILAFAVGWRLLPATGYVGPTTSVTGWAAHIALPALAISITPAAYVARQLRTSLVGVYGENYVTGAVVRGLGPRRVLFRHVLRNAAEPAVTALGLYAPAILGGAVITETVFALPGLGVAALAAANTRDVPIVQGALLVSIALVLACSLLIEAVAGWLRPGVRS